MMRWLPLLALSSCGGPPAPEPPQPACPRSLLPFTATMDGGVERLHDGSPLEIFAGPQGGFHVLVGVQATGLPRSGALEWRLSSPGGTVLATRSLEVGHLRLEDVSCGWLRPRDLLPFLRNEDVEPARGAPAVLSARLDREDMTIAVELR